MVAYGCGGPARKSSESDRFGMALADAARGLEANRTVTAIYQLESPRQYRFVLFPPGTDAASVDALRLPFAAAGLTRQGAGMVALIFADTAAGTHAAHWGFMGRATRVFDVEKHSGESVRLTLEGTERDYAIVDVR